MIIRKKDAVKLLYTLARTDKQVDFLMEGEKKQRKDPNYDLVQDYVLTFPCPPVFLGFVTSDFIILKNPRHFILEYGLEEHFPDLLNREF